jgi:hypothetical protein
VVEYELKFEGSIEPIVTPAVRRVNGIEAYEYNAKVLVTFQLLPPLPSACKSGVWSDGFTIHREHYRQLPPNSFAVYPKRIDRGAALPGRLIVLSIWCYTYSKQSAEHAADMIERRRNHSCLIFKP